MIYKPEIKTFNDAAIPKLKLNDKVQITQECFNEKTSKNEVTVIWDGEVISINSLHFTVKKKNGLKQSFKYSDFIEDIYSLKFRCK